MKNHIVLLLNYQTFFLVKFIGYFFIRHHNCLNIKIFNFFVHELNRLIDFRLGPLKLNMLLAGIPTVNFFATYDLGLNIGKVGLQVLK